MFLWLWLLHQVYLQTRCVVRVAALIFRTLKLYILDVIDKMLHINGMFCIINTDAWCVNMNANFAEIPRQCMNWWKREFIAVKTVVLEVTMLDIIMKYKLKAIFHPDKYINRKPPVEKTMGTFTCYKIAIYFHKVINL